MIAEGIHRLEPPFSAAERLSREVDSQWEGHKDRGNAAFQAGDWDSAIAHYSDGHFVANGSLEDSFDAVLDALSDHPQGSPQNPVSGIQQLACKLFGYMGRQVGILQFDHGGVKMDSPTAPRRSAWRTARSQRRRPVSCRGRWKTHCGRPCCARSTKRRTTA